MSFWLQLAILMAAIVLGARYKSGKGILEVIREKKLLGPTVYEKRN